MQERIGKRFTNKFRTTLMIFEIWTGWGPNPLSKLKNWNIDIIDILISKLFYRKWAVRIISWRPQMPKLTLCGHMLLRLYTPIIYDNFLITEEALSSWLRTFYFQSPIFDLLFFFKVYTLRLSRLQQLQHQGAVFIATKNNFSLKSNNFSPAAHKN